MKKFKRLIKRILIAPLFFGAICTGFTSWLIFGFTAIDIPLIEELINWSEK